MISPKEYQHYTVLVDKLYNRFLENETSAQKIAKAQLDEPLKAFNEQKIYQLPAEDNLVDNILLKDLGPITLYKLAKQFQLIF